MRLISMTISVFICIFFSFNAFSTPKAKVATLQKTVASSATPEPISASSLKVKSVIIQSMDSNSSEQRLVLSSTEPDRNFFEMPSVENNGTPLLYDLNDIYIDVEVNGEGVNVLYVIDSLN